MIQPQFFLNPHQLNMDISVENDILDTSDKVFGVIYRMWNTVDNTQYIGQTVSHRKNKGKYRPFGMIGRFNDHVSEALNNTKKKQCSYLNNAIRKYGKEAFSVELVEYCECSEMDSREQHYISLYNTMYPHGYNLTKGGKTSYVESFITDLQTPKKRGGCAFRSETTREKMSKRGKEAATDAVRSERSRHAMMQHMHAKKDRYRDCEIDPTMLDTYIRTKGKRVIVLIDGIQTNFTSKYETLEETRGRVKEFLNELIMQRYQTAGNP